MAVLIGSAAQIGGWPDCPFSRTDLSHDLHDGDAQRGEVVQNGYTDFELGHLTVEVPRHEALSQQFRTMHLGVDAPLAVVAAPSSPECTAQIFRRPKGVVARDGTCGDGLPGFRTLAGWYDGMGTPFGDGIMALARVTGTVVSEAGYLLMGRDLAEQFGKHRGIVHIVAGDFNSPNFQCFLVDREMDLAPDAAFCTAMLARSAGKQFLDCFWIRLSPIAFTLHLDPASPVRSKRWRSPARCRSEGATDPATPDAGCSRQGASGDG